MGQQRTRKSLRILLDGTMCTIGGGFTYLVNVAPRMAARAPEHRFLLLGRNPLLAEAMPRAENLEVRLLPPVGIAGRFRFSYLQAPRIAKRCGRPLHTGTSL
ncbi:MAG: hypothetical protein QF890_17035 [Myxococcota bacterium]|nr:hypothetical protein [Deltaproteobacteria bacterium]MCP4242981.1 hypothetical protein [bacterium]MDP6244700.1 hypothetical protein [Myxococcota bacterium]MCP5067629.1 hypothetical protein [bacterium]MDP7073113.1 hypothetical protein [Myxococcota bacterium]